MDGRRLEDGHRNRDRKHRVGRERRNRSLAGLAGLREQANRAPNSEHQEER
jgi:hypothetical protein